MVSTLRLALRSLLRSRAFTVTVIATLAIGIGLNAAIFTVVDCVLLRPLGYRDADRIVGLQTRFLNRNRSIQWIGGDDYNDVADQVKGLEATAYYQAGPEGVAVNGTAEYVSAARVSPRFMEIMGVHPVAGRLFHGEDSDGRDAVISEKFAREHFGSANAAVGQSIRFQDRLETVVGVLPEGFSFPGNALVWIEGKREPETASRTSYSQQAIGKRRAGVQPEQLGAELAAFSSRLQQAYPDDSGKAIEAVPLQEQIVGTIRPTLRLLMGSVGILLLIACANITHLQLVRATQQVRAVTIRTALGASRWALAVRALLEAALLAAGGSCAALLLAFPALKLLMRLAPQDLPRLAEIRLNADVFLFSFLLAFAVVAITAVLPVWRSWHVDPSAALRQDASRGTEGRGSARLRDAFTIAEVALTLTLSVASILLARQLIAQSREDLGFAADSLITLDAHAVASTPMPNFPADPTPASMAAYRAALVPVAQAQSAQLAATLETVSSTPGVVSAAAILGAPMGFDGPDVSYAVKGRQVFAPPYEHLPNADVRPVTPNLFRTMSIPLLRGRTLNENDRFGSPYVLLINRALSLSIFPNEDPIGKQIVCGYDDVGTPWTIVGVVADIHSDSPGAPPRPTFYIPLAQHPWAGSDTQLVVQTSASPETMTETLRRRLSLAYPETAVKATTMRENIGETQRADNFRSLLFGSFAAVSILLAAVGMYGVTSYSVAQRRFEFGLRFALGANRAQVLGMVLRKALSVAGVGVVLGIGLSFELLRVLSSMLGKLPAFDPIAYALAALAVLAIALCATLLPARRASTINPMTVLRSE